MKIQIISDTHLEFFSYFREGIDFTGTKAEVLIIAGDLCSPEKHLETLDYLGRHYKRVLLVLGNHDYYGFSKEFVHNALKKAPGNVSWLNNSSVKIKDYRFLGTTLWFRDDPLNPLYAPRLNDFHYIEDFESWIYQENHAARQFLEREIQPGDVVITHHIPSMQSVPETFRTDPLNRFFLCDMEALIHYQKPLLWVHGHTHTSFDYTLEETRVLCNPKGYRGQINKDYNPGLVIEI